MPIKVNPQVCVQCPMRMKDTYTEKDRYYCEYKFWEGFYSSKTFQSVNKMPEAYQSVIEEGMIIPEKCLYILEHTVSQ